MERRGGVVWVIGVGFTEILKSLKNIGTEILKRVIKSLSIPSPMWVNSFICIVSKSLPSLLPSTSFYFFSWRIYIDFWWELMSHFFSLLLSQRNLPTFISPSVNTCIWQCILNAAKMLWICIVPCLHAVFLTIPICQKENCLK